MRKVMASRRDDMKPADGIAEFFSELGRRENEPLGLTAVSHEGGAADPARLHARSAHHDVLPSLVEMNAHIPDEYRAWAPGNGRPDLARFVSEVLDLRPSALQMAAINAALRHRGSIREDLEAATVAASGVAALT
jgi:hypothetical protein